MLNKMMNYIKQNISVVWFVYIFLGIVAINFANSFITFVVLSIVSNFLLFFLGNRKLNLEFLLSLLLSIIPLIGLALFSLLSKFNLDPNSNYSLAKYVFFFLSTVSVPFLGFQCSANRKFDIKLAIKVIYIGLAIWMLINLFITVIEYGPFYTLIYKDRYFFDYGHLARISVDRTAYMLLGFNVEVVTIELFCVMASVLSSAILALFFVSFKDDKRSFFEYLICGCIGLLCLLLTFNTKLLLLYIALLIGFTLVILFGKNIIKFNKTTKVVVWCFLGIIGAIYIVFMLNALNVKPLATFIENNQFLNRLFNTNRVINKYRNIIRAMADNKTFNGFTPYLIGQDSLSLSGSWLFDMFAIGQVFGWLMFIILVVVLFIKYFKYVKESHDKLESKILLLGIILGIIIPTVISYDSMPYFNNKEYLLIFFISPFIMLMFIYGYINKNEEEDAI